MTTSQPDGASTAPPAVVYHTTHDTGFAAATAAPPAAERRVRFSRRALLVGAAQAMALLAACAPRAPAADSLSPDVAPTATPPPRIGGAAAAAASPQGGGRACALPAVVVPTPVPYPGYTQLEPSTGLHVTGEAKIVDPATYRLHVTGLVDAPYSLSFDEIRCLPAMEAAVELVCPGFFTDRCRLTGTSLAGLVALARPQRMATGVTLTSIDPYGMVFDLAELTAPENFVAYQWNDEPLPPSHGFPLRAVFPAKSGSHWVKWLTRIALT